MCFKPEYGKWYWTNGRLNRKSYLCAALILLAFLALVCALALACLYFAESLKEANFVFLPVLILAGVFCLYLNYMLISKRFHDLGISAWATFIFPVLGILSQVTSGTDFFTLTDAVALIASLASIVLSLTLFFKKGQVGANIYGADPLEKPKTRKKK